MASIVSNAGLRLGKIDIGYAVISVLDTGVVLRFYQYGVASGRLLVLATEVMKHILNY